jgi:hypothetical protein
MGCAQLRDLLPGAENHELTELDPRGDDPALALAPADDVLAGGAARALRLARAPAR